MSMGGHEYVPKITPVEAVTAAVTEIPTRCQCIWVLAQLEDGTIEAHVKYINNACSEHSQLERIAA